MEPERLSGNGAAGGFTIYQLPANDSRIAKRDALLNATVFIKTNILKMFYTIPTREECGRRDRPNN